jgi:hypothetical protein
LSQKEYSDLVHAKEILENPSFAIKAANLIGKPVEFAIDAIDSKTLNRATSKALRTSLDIAIETMATGDMGAPSNWWHKIAVMGTGAGGGFFGLPALAIELPVSTTIMLRSIADIARSQGHDLSDISTRLSCLEVFALGSDRTESDDASESAYYSARAGLAVEMRMAIDAAEKMGTRALQEAIAKGQVPVLIKLINTIAARFGITVSEKLVAQAVPVIGAAGGASINLMFMNHFQDMAEGHFIIKRLENKYGEKQVRIAYDGILRR